MALSDAVAFAVAAWTLDETSGTRADSVGSHTLSDNNTVVSGTGQFGDAADFEADNSEWLSESNSTDFDPGSGDFCVRAWVKLESKSANMCFLSKSDVDTVGRSWILYYNAGADRFYWYVELSSSGATQVAANNFGSPSTGVWYLLQGWVDQTGNLSGISVNAGTADTTSIGSETIVTRNCDFRIGRYDGGNYMDGLVDDVVVLKGYFLDATERTEDYNSGTGVAFADWAGGGTEEGAGSSAGVATAAATSEATKKATAASNGAALPTGTSAALKSSPFSSTGAATAAATGRSQFRAAFSSAGLGAASAESLASGSGAASSAGAATVAATSAALKSSPFSAAGLATTAGVGRSEFRAAFSSAGAATADATSGNSTVEAVASSAGSASASATSKALKAASFSSAGVASSNVRGFADGASGVGCGSMMLKGVGSPSS